MPSLIHSSPLLNCRTIAYLNSLPLLELGTNLPRPSPGEVLSFFGVSPVNYSNSVNYSDPVYLLLWGDIHPCPCPSTNLSGENSECKCFEKKGLHFVHLNIRSSLPKLDELRIFARNIRAVCLCITETWLDETFFDSEVQIQN